MINSPYSSFRSDIQVFRAIAVLAVVAYHAGWWVKSGFIGVDLFFVISGFVISGLLMKTTDLKLVKIKYSHSKEPMIRYALELRIMTYSNSWDFGKFFVKENFD